MSYWSSAPDVNRGYVGYSMSRRAAEAYENGEMPKSKWTKKAMLEAFAAWCRDNGRAPNKDMTKWTKAELWAGLMSESSWHHTSKFFNETFFYAVDDCLAQSLTHDETPAEAEAREAREAEARAKAREAEARARAWEKALFQAREEFSDAHGYALGSGEHYAAAFPETAEVRTSRKGNKYLIFHLPSGKARVDGVPVAQKRVWFVPEIDAFAKQVESELAAEILERGNIG